MKGFILGFEEWVLKNVMSGVRDGNYRRWGSPQNPGKILGMAHRWVWLSQGLDLG